MNFVLIRGKDFSEHFNFKNAKGSPIVLPNGTFKIVLERGSFAREYTVENGKLSKMRNRVVWSIPSAESIDFEFSTMYYTLYVEDREIARGLLRIQ